MANSGRKDAEHAADPRVDLAVQRTELALVRTQLSWVRTAIGLMGAGVALDKGLRLLHQARVLSGEALVRNAHSAGLTLTGISTVLLMVVTLDYRQTARWLASLKEVPPRTLPPAIVVSLIGIVLGAIVFADLLADKSP